MPETFAININQLAFSWQHQSTPILQIPHWQVATGQRVFIYGRSGSGKSTLLNIIAGILTPDSGTIEVLNQDLVQLNQKQRDRFRAQHMGVIFQQFNLIPYLTVKENIRLSQSFSGKSPPANKTLQDLMESLGLDPIILGRTSAQLSVGQQQRVAVARALYHEPELIIADEPTSALDSDSRDDFIQLLFKQSEQTQSTVLFVSHDKNLAKHFDHTIDLAQLNQVKTDHAF